MLLSICGRRSWCSVEIVCLLLRCSFYAAYCCFAIKPVTSSIKDINFVPNPKVNNLITGIFFALQLLLTFHCLFLDAGRDTWTERRGILQLQNFKRNDQKLARYLFFLSYFVVCLALPCDVYQSPLSSSVECIFFSWLIFTLPIGRGVSYLFDIQVKTFNSIYDGKDVVAQARTGTGKTFSFAIPLIEKLLSETEERRRGRAPKVCASEH